MYITLSAKSQRPDLTVIARASTEEAELRGLGAVGDILLRYFDRNGELVSSDMNGRVIGIPLGTFLRIPTRVAAAGGRRKVAAIEGALRGGWINVLITDFSTAQAVLNSSD